MSITVNDITKDALLEIGVIREGQTITSEQAANGLKKLNQMLLDWERDGIELGFYPLTAGADVVPIDVEDEWGVTANFAVLLAGSYGAPVNPATALEASRTKKRLEKSTAAIVEMALDHLPTGNQDRYNINTDES